MMESDDLLSNIQLYRNTVLLYEAAHAEINRLITANNGGTEFMSDGDLARYRELARRRDELFNEMRVMETHLLDDDIVL